MLMQYIAVRILFQKVKSGAKSEEFSYVGSQIPTTLLSHLPTEASLGMDRKKG